MYGPDRRTLRGADPCSIPGAFLMFLPFFFSFHKGHKGLIHKSVTMTESSCKIVKILSIPKQAFSHRIPLSRDPSATENNNTIVKKEV